MGIVLNPAGGTALDLVSSAQVQAALAEVLPSDQGYIATRASAHR